MNELVIYVMFLIVWIILGVFAFRSIYQERDRLALKGIKTYEHPNINIYILLGAIAYLYQMHRPKVKK